jgi:hypothetical protein
MFGLIQFIKYLPVMYRYVQYKARGLAELMVVKLVLIVIILPVLTKILTDLAVYQNRKGKK